MCAQRLSVDCMRGLLDHPISGLRHGGSLVHPPPLMLGDELLLQHGLNAGVFSTKAVLRRHSIYTHHVEVLRQLLLAKGVAPLPVAPNASPLASSPISDHRLQTGFVDTDTGFGNALNAAHTVTTPGACRCDGHSARRPGDPWSARTLPCRRFPMPCSPR